MRIVLAAGANNDLLGYDFFGVDVRKFVNNNEILNDLTCDLLWGRSGYGVYYYEEGERLATQCLILSLLALLHLRCQSYCLRIEYHYSKRSKKTNTAIGRLI